ncbi:MAG: uracil-DNA glycosylase [Legionellales bacterium]|nr:uracil-DNA glycosylase [Legionellales bacterium]
MPETYFAGCWLPVLQHAIEQMDQHYLAQLHTNTHWLPGKSCLFNAFRQPLTHTRYILFGESPYPRAQSANGYAFWDSAVQELWSPTGLAKPINRATSLRHFIKMLLIAEHGSSFRADQPAIAQLSKTAYVTRLDELFTNLLAEGFLLLNASLVLSDQPVRYDATQWRPFIQSILTQLVDHTSQPITLILWGKLAQWVDQIAPKTFPRLISEHPYNVSFIHHQAMLDFFRPLQLLQRERRRPML